VDWIWDGYLRHGGITLLTGLWKAGKTTLFSHLLGSISRGETQFLGRALSPTKVLLITQETDDLWDGRTKEHGLSDERIFIQRGAGDFPQPFLGRPTQTEWEAFITHLAKAIREERYGLIIVDVLSDFWPVEDENNASEVTDALQPLRQLCHEGAGILLLHHPTKGKPAKGMAARGSGALPGFVDVLLELRFVQQSDVTCSRRLLTGRSRYPRTPSDLVIELTTQGYVALKSDKEKARGEAAKIKQEAMLILKNLPTEPPGRTAEELAEMVPRGSRKKETHIRRIRDLLSKGAECGTWRREGAGTKTDPYRFWLSEEPGKDAASPGAN
jgi:hypothetical protein